MSPEPSGERGPLAALPTIQRLDGNTFLCCLDRRVIRFVLIRHAIGKQHDDFRRVGPAVALEFCKRRCDAGGNICATRPGQESQRLDNGLAIGRHWPGDIAFAVETNDADFDIAF